MHPWTRGDVSEAEMAQTLEQMSTAAVANPQGENPEIWLAKLHGMPEADAAGGGAMTDAPPIGGGAGAGWGSAGEGGDDMNMDEDEDEDEDENEF